MTCADHYVPEEILKLLTTSEISYLDTVFNKCSGYPTLEELWKLMDEQWDLAGCDENCIDDRFSKFYRHPVWMLNGLFIEKHNESLLNRQAFTDWVVRKSPKRIADFGGGFGGLARFIGEAMPDVQVEVVEPFPHPAAIYLAENTPNVRFVPKLTGVYDMLIATDVFEHVEDPLQLCIDTAYHLKTGGQYLIANCFYPVIKCHLPQVFHFRYTWNYAMEAMGFELGDKFLYAEEFVKCKPLDIRPAKKIEIISTRLYILTKKLPSRLARIISSVLLSLEKTRRIKW